MERSLRLCETLAIGDVYTGRGASDEAAYCLTQRLVLLYTPNMA